MGIEIVNLHPMRESRRDDLAGLRALLGQLVGEPYRFARVSYGNELTLHFGDLRPARSPKLAAQPYGRYILGLLGSAWVWKSEEHAALIDGRSESGAVLGGKPLEYREIESLEFVEPGCRVIAADPFLVHGSGGIGLELGWSDGSSFVALPTPAEPDRPEDQHLPQLADWELLTPHGLISAGPNRSWSFEPKDTDRPAP